MDRESISKNRAKVLTNNREGTMIFVPFSIGK